jgi:hypothetical protein
MVGPLFDSRLGIRTRHDHKHALPARQDHPALRHSIEPEEAARAIRAAAGEGEAPGCALMDWSPPRKPPLRPAGFIEPCTPTMGDRPPAGPAWSSEIKHDGYRLWCGATARTGPAAARRGSRSRTRRLRA